MSNAKSESGVIVDLRDGMATVAMAAAAHEGCKSCGACRASADGRKMVMNLPAPKGLKVGDCVTVNIPLPGMGRSATLLLLIPAGLLVAAIIAGELLRGAGVLPGGSGVSVLAGFALMTLWYVGVSLYDRRLRRGSRNRPAIVIAESGARSEAPDA